MTTTFSIAQQPKPKAAGFGLLIAPLILSAIGVGLNIWSLATEAPHFGDIFSYDPAYGVLLIAQGASAVVLLLGIVAILFPGFRKLSVFAFLIAGVALFAGYVYTNVDLARNGGLGLDRLYVPAFSQIKFLNEADAGTRWMYLVTDLPIYLNIASVVFAGIYFAKNRSKATPVATNAFSTSEPILTNPEPIANDANATASATPNQGSTPSGQLWEVQLPGAQGYSIDSNTLLSYVNAGSVRADTLIKDLNTGTVYQAKQIPGLFSSKAWLTALLLSIFLGQLGIDRFYTGHIGLGIGKLLTCGGAGVWTLVDIILFATKSVKDPQGKVLA